MQRQEKRREENLNSIKLHPRLKNLEYLDNDGIALEVSNILERRDIIPNSGMTLRETINSKSYAVYFGYTKLDEVEHCAFLTTRGLNKPGKVQQQVPVLTNEDNSNLNQKKLKKDGKFIFK